MTALSDLPDSNTLFEIVRGRTDHILLSFSGGKDSIAMWLWLRDRIEITPYFLYLVPGLQSDNEMLAYYERFFGQKIHRMPHPILYRAINDIIYQPPQNVAKIWSMMLQDFDFAAVDRVVASEFVYQDTDWYCAVGMRATDNLDRRYMIMQNGVIGEAKRRFYYAIWDWNMERVYETIQKSGIKFPKQYRYNGRTITSLHYQYLKPLRDHYPGDFEKIKAFFPLIDLEFLRWEYLYEKYQHQEKEN